MVGRDDKRFIAGKLEIGKEGALRLASKEVVAVVANTWGLDAIPFEKDVGVFEVHQVLLPRNAIHILENVITEHLMKDQAREFMFVLGYLRIPGGVQAIINPVAIR